MTQVDTAKIKDLAHETSATSGQNVMTTDHGTAIVNPDSWYVSGLYEVFVTPYLLSGSK
jgi:hypothetical protein